MANTDTPFTVHDRRRTHFFIVDNIIIDEYGAELGPYGLAVYMALCRFANSEAQCWPSLQTIADRTGISRRQVIREIKKLESLRLISVIPQKDEKTGEPRSNLYVLLDSSDSQSPSSAPQTLPSDSQSPPPSDWETPPSDYETPEQNTDNKTLSLEENPENNGGGSSSISDQISEKYAAITGDEPTEKDRQHLAELVTYPQWVVDESLAALRERILNPNKETIRNVAAWLVGTVRRKASEENERTRRVEEVNRTLTARRRYEVPEKYRDIVVGCH